MKNKNIIADKSYAFALRIVKLNQYLNEKTKQFDISRQVLRSGTSIGANIEEGVGAESKKDFIHKLSIAYKEARETKYWLRLLKDSEIIEVNLANSLLNDAEEILAILGKIKITASKAD